MFDISNQLILDQIPGAIAWKDVSLRYQGANKKLLLELKLEHEQQLIGRCDSELTQGTTEIMDFFKQLDLQALQGHSVEVLHHLSDANNDRTYFLQKVPLRDQQTQIIGLIYYCTPWTQPDLLTTLSKIDQQYQPQLECAQHYSLIQHDNPAALSKRELECLFLQLRGKTAREIAAILNLSRRTIEFYADNIKNKLGCQNKAEV